MHGCRFVLVIVAQQDAILSPPETVTLIMSRDLVGLLWFLIRNFAYSKQILLFIKATVSIRTSLIKAETKEFFDSLMVESNKNQANKLN